MKSKRAQYLTTQPKKDVLSLAIQDAKTRRAFLH